MGNNSQYTVGVISVTNSLCTELEQEYRLGFPKEVKVQMSSAPLEKVSYSGLMTFMEALPSAAEVFAPEEPDLIVVPSMTGSCIRGHEIVNMLEQHCGLPVIVPSLEFVKLIQELGKSKIAIVSAFGVELGLLEQLFFRNHGIMVTDMVNVYDNPDGNRAFIDTIDSRLVLEKVLEADFSEAEVAVFDSPTYRLKPVIRELEAHIQKPILSVNQVLIYSALRRLGLAEISSPIAKYFTPHK